MHCVRIRNTDSTVDCRPRYLYEASCRWTLIAGHRYSISFSFLIMCSIIPIRGNSIVICIFILPFFAEAIKVALSASAETNATSLYASASRRLSRAQGGSKQAHRRHANRREALIFLGNMTARPIPFKMAESLLPRGKCVGTKKGCRPVYSGRLLQELAYSSELW